MNIPEKSEQQSYDALYHDFGSPLMRQVRLEAYGKDIGQHSWVTAEDLESDIPRLQLTPESALLDLGCGPGGPLTYVVGLVRCHGSGTDVSSEAIKAGRARASALGLNDLVSFEVADSNQRMGFAAGSFDAVMSLDVILHLRDRGEVFRDVARVLAPGGRFLFTDAGVVTGPVSDEDIRSRAIHGHIQFVPRGFNERAVELSGLRLIEVYDRTAGLLKNAGGRLAARLAHRAELEKREGDHYERQLRYLESVIRMSEGGGMSRFMYLAESPAGSAG